MSKLSIANLKKTIYYMKRNGLRDTYLAALERLGQKEQKSYVYEAPDDKTLLEQSRKAVGMTVTFSILVPAYRTAPVYLRAMIDSVLKQSYGLFELVIADASDDTGVENEVKKYQDGRIKYLHLAENKGISDNTNAALQAASGDYIGLLDHDDVLSPDALFEMAEAIKFAAEKGTELKLLYSDEDKCDESGESYYEPHVKTGFNLDLILSNNYFCHFTVMKAELMKRLGFRREYDGAQDFDLVLRAVKEILDGGTSQTADEAISGKASQTAGKHGFNTEAEKEICHIPKILYHWRCHRGSTAQNPQSKQYAYEAGGRAIADFLKQSGIAGTVSPTKHVGFYQVRYEPDILRARPDVGAVGGCIFNGKNKITGGIYLETGECPCRGLRRGFSGYMHRASLMQDTDAVDVRLMKIKTELFPVVEAAVEAVKRENAGNVNKSSQNISVCMGADDRIQLQSAGLTEERLKKLGTDICREIRKAGYRIVWDPSWTEKIK